MKIRLNPKVEEIVLKHPRFGSIESLQEYVNGNERQLFPSEHAVVLNGEKISLGESAKLQAGELAMVLRRTGDEEAEYLAVKIMDSSNLPKSERVHTAWAYPLKEEVAIFPSRRRRRDPKPLWSAPPTAKPAQGHVTFVTPREVGEWKQGVLRTQYEVEECPSCHRLQPNSAAVACKFCGEIVAQSTCHICGFNLSPPGAPVPSACGRCGAPSLHRVQEGYSAERLIGMYGGDWATFAFAFHPNAHETLSRLPLHRRSEMNRLYRTLQYGCAKDRCKLSTGAIVIFFTAKGRLVKATPEHLRQFDALIREAGMGYLMSKDEVILAEKIAEEVRC